MLLETKAPGQALEQFKATLQKEPGRFRALYGAAHAAELSGSRKESQKYFRELLKSCVHADKSGRAERFSKLLPHFRKISFVLKTYSAPIGHAIVC